MKDDERTRRRAQEQADRLHAEVMATDGVDLSPGRAGVTAILLSLLVIGGTYALIPLAVWVALAVQTRWIGFLGAGLLLAIVWAVRPRRPKLPDDAVVVTDAPQLRALLDEVAAGVGTTAPRTIALVPDINAAVYDGPRRQGRVLLLGVPLWLAMPAQGRVSLLGHELAHFSSGDTRRSGIVGAAFAVLGGWYYLLDGDAVDGEGTAIGDGGAGGIITELSAFLASALLWLVGLVPLGMGRLLEHVTARDSRRAEYRADLVASRLSGTPGALASLAVLERVHALDASLQRSAFAREDTLAAARAFDARSHAAVADGVGLDSPSRLDSHPPTAYRVEAVARTRFEATLVVAPSRWDLIDAELAPAMATIERRVRDSYLDR